MEQKTCGKGHSPYPQLERGCSKSVDYGSVSTVAQKDARHAAAPPWSHERQHFCLRALPMTHAKSMDTLTCIGSFKALSTMLLFITNDVGNVGSGGPFVTHQCAGEGRASRSTSKAHPHTTPPHPDRRRNPNKSANKWADRFFGKTGSQCPGSQSQTPNTPSLWLLNTCIYVETQNISQFSKKNFVSRSVHGP